MLGRYTRATYGSSLWWQYIYIYKQQTFGTLINLKRQEKILKRGGKTNISSHTYTTSLCARTNCKTSEKKIAQIFVHCNQSEEIRSRKRCEKTYTHKIFLTEKSQFPFVPYNSKFFFTLPPIILKSLCTLQKVYFAIYQHITNLCNIVIKPNLIHSNVH